MGMEKMQETSNVYQQMFEAIRPVAGGDRV